MPPTPAPIPLSDAETLNILFKNFDPIKAAPPEFYVPCSEVRGGTRFVKKLCAALSKAHDDDPKKRTYLHALFAGHIGGGKSSELLHLRGEMQDSNTNTSQKHFFPVYVDMRQYLDEFDAAKEEILLAIVCELAASFKGRDDDKGEKLGITLADSYFTKRMREIGEILFSDVKVEGVELSAGGKDVGLPEAKAKIQLLRNDSVARNKVREALRGTTSTFLTEMKTLFAEARTKLNTYTKQHGATQFTDFVLIVDGLDRLYGYNGNTSPDESQKALFMDDADVLAGLDAHCVFTIDLATARAYQPELSQKYGGKPYLLPMIKIEERGDNHPQYHKGRAKLKEILQKRMPAKVLVENVFAPAALDALITYSAGHVRNLMLFARAATLGEQQTLPLSAETVLTAIAEENPFHNPDRGESDWDKLAALELGGTQDWQTREPDYRRLLTQLYVCEYINGSADGIIADLEEWYAVNPLAREGRGFKRAVERAKANAAVIQPAA